MEVMFVNYLLLYTIGRIFIIYNVFLYEAVRSDDHEYRLVKNLLKDYNSFARPSLNHSHPTNVSFDLALSQLIDVDEKNQLITTNAWVNMNWIDYKLMWNESEYGGIQEIRLPWDRIWKPDVILYNNADALASMAQISTHMQINSNGSVTWLSTSIYRSSCSIDVQYFPFDKQNCSLSFASWTYDGDSLNLLKSTSNNEGDISNYLSNGEWNLNELLVERHVKIYSCCPNPYPNVTYYIVMTRRPLFYVFNMILPSLLITLVGFLGFLIPPDSGEKISMGVTTLLSMTVFLMAISDSMPPNSDSVPLIATYYFGSMLIISLATAGTVLTLNVFKRGDSDEPVPPLIQKIFFEYIARVLFINISLNRELDSSVKKIYTNLKAYYINSSVEKFINLETSKLLRQSKEGSRLSLGRQSNVNAEHLLYDETAHINKKYKNQLTKKTSWKRSESDYFLSSRDAEQKSPRHKNKSTLILKDHSKTGERSFGERYYNPEMEVENAKKNFETNSLYMQQQPRMGRDDQQSVLVTSSSRGRHKTEKNNNQQGFMNYTHSAPVDYNAILNSASSCLKCTDMAGEKKRLSRMLKVVNDNLEKNELKEVINLYKDEIKAQWTQLAQVIDAMLLYTFTISTFFLLIYLWNKANNSGIINLFF